MCVKEKEKLDKKKEKGCQISDTLASTYTSFDLIPVLDSAMHNAALVHTVKSVTWHSCANVKCGWTATDNS